MFGSEVAFNPGSLLAIWAAGIAAAAAVVAYWRIVGPGYLWLTAGVTSLIGAGAWVFDPGPVVGAAWIAGILAGLLARRPALATLALALSAVLYLLQVAGSGPGPLVWAVTGSLALGGITGEMLLGHWYLIDPRIPRRPLRNLALAGAGGVLLDATVVLVSSLPMAVTAGGLITSVALAGTSLLLMVAVWFALGYPSYPGVMAATGLSYLAVLTSLGSVSLVRVIVG